MQADGWLRIASAAGTAAVDPAIGNLRVLAFEADGRMLEPLNTAWWVGDPAAVIPEGTAPVEQSLAGDFFCAPFGGGDIEPAPIHGWPANSRWRPLETGRDALRLRLERPVFGATIEKRIRLAPDAPLLYQEHLITGGEGGLTVAHHPMVRLRGGGTLSVSPKRAILTPDTALEPGRNRLACPAEGHDLAAFPGADGAPVDLTRMPIGERHEDFVTLVEAAGNPLGWTAVLRDAEDDIVFFLKDPAVLPVTMLWQSNAGRDRAPWGGRHTGVIGVEDGCAAGAAGHRAALGDNAVARTGVATCLALAPGSSHRIAHVTGAVARPDGWRRVADIAVAGDTLTLTEAGGASLALPVAGNFLRSA
jgi:hypothetical protein